MRVPGRIVAGEPGSAETGAPGLRMLDHALLRVAAWPVETLDGFVAHALADAAARVLAITEEVEQGSTALTAALHEMVPRVPDRAVRAYLLAAKRTIHAGPGVLPPSTAAVDATLDTVAPEFAAHLSRQGATRRALAAERAAFEAHFAVELQRQRLELRRVTGDDSFRRALEIGNPLLAARWELVRDGVPSDRARMRRLETSIFHTLMRAVGRPTPQDAWAGVTSVSPVAEEESSDGDRSWSIASRTAHHCVTVELEPFASVLAALRRLPRYRAAFVRLNPTMRPVRGAWRYARVQASGIEWQTAPDDSAARRLLEAFGDGRPRRVEEVVRVLASDDDVAAANLRDAAARLLDVDGLEVDLAIPSAAESVWAALESVAPSLLPEDRPQWVAFTGRVRRVCEYLGRNWNQLDPADIRGLRQLVAAEIDALARALGLSGQRGRTVIHLDTCVPFVVTWNRAARHKFEHALREVFAFHAAEGAAEHYRRASLRAVLAASTAAADDDSLLGLVDGTGLRRDPPEGDDIDTHHAIFARLMRGPCPEADARGREWERRLAPVSALPQVTLTDVVCDRLVPGGPEGAFVFSALNGPASVADWGRPQAGLFVSRWAPALRERDGAVPALEEVKCRFDATDATRAVFADVVGSDPGRLNTAIRPRLTSLRLEPHGSHDTSLRGMRLELDSATLRPWVIGADGERILPTYQSAAAIGGVDPCSWLLFRLAMGHGWEFVSFGFPALAMERSVWHHLPQLALTGGTVVSPERWTIPGETLQAIGARDGSGRYLAWRAEAERLRLPAVVRVRWDPHPAASPILMRTDSPLAVSALFTRLPPDAPRLVVTEFAGGVDVHCVRSPEGEHHLAELAVSWFDDSYLDSVLRGDEVEETPGAE